MRCYNSGLKAFILEYAPDFCWVTAFDILKLVEQEELFEDVTMDSLKCTLSKLKKTGEFITKPWPYEHRTRGTPPGLYLRVREN